MASPISSRMMPPCKPHSTRPAGPIIRGGSYPVACRHPGELQMRASEASGVDSDSSPSISGQQEPIKVPLSELPNPKPKAMQALNKLQTKTGLARMVGESLQSTSLTIIGDNTALNAAVGKALATQLGWFPTSSRAILSGMKTTAEGSALVDAEASVLKGLRSQKRVVVATMAAGAAADPAIYRELWGSIIIRIDEDDKYAAKPKTPERACHAAAAEIQLVIKPNKGFGKAPLNTPTEKAQAQVPFLLKQLAELLQDQPDLVKKKQRYCELGYRGDWPELQPPAWNPLVDRLDRKALPAAWE